MTNRPEIVAPPRLTTAECEELNDWSEAVGFQADYQQQGNGPFEAWFDMSVGEDLRVVDQYCSREMCTTGIPPDGYIPILITRNRGTKGIFQGKELEENEVAIMRPGFEGTYRMPADLRMTTLCIPETRLCRSLETMAGRELDDVLPGTRLVSLPKETVTRLTWLAEQVLASPRDMSGAADTRLWLSEIDDHFLTALTTGLTDPKESDPRSLARKNRVDYVRTARDFIEGHLDTPLGLETLSRKTGVSPRTLEYAFRDIFDTTPLQYVKTRRLHAARLREANDDPALTVTDVALEYGFAHLSYFARDYHALFGEYPSETLRGSRFAAS